jgi:hypothetical protein
LDFKSGVWSYLWGGQSSEATMFTFNMNGAAKVGITRCTVVCRVQNMTDAGAIMLKHGQGAILGDNTNTAGTIRVGGEANWIDAGVGDSVVVGDDTTRAVVWDEDLSKHSPPWAAADYVKRIAGMVGEYKRIHTIVRDGDGNLTSAVMDIYDNETDYDAQTNRIARYNVTATFVSQLMAEFGMKPE